jgi:hypothetical protein
MKTTIELLKEAQAKGEEITAVYRHRETNEVVIGKIDDLLEMREKGYKCVMSKRDLELAHSLAKQGLSKDPSIHDDPKKIEQLGRNIGKQLLKKKKDSLMNVMDAILMRAEGEKDEMGADDEKT